MHLLFASLWREARSLEASRPSRHVSSATSQEKSSSWPACSSWYPKCSWALSWDDKREDDVERAENIIGR